MRAALRPAIATAIAMLLVAGSAVPTLSGTGAAPALDGRITGATCNPAGHAGLRVTASASVTGGTLRGETLFVGEFQAIADPAFAPFPWTGSTLANWQRNDGWRRGPASDTPTLDTTDPQSYDHWNHAVDLWTGSALDSWWFVSYEASTSTGRILDRWYVSCPSGTHVDGNHLRQVTYVEEAGQR